MNVGHRQIAVVLSRIEIKAKVLHVGFLAESKEAVGAFPAGGLSSGGADNGKPGPRQGAEKHHAAFVFYRDGNNIEACLREWAGFKTTRPRRFAGGRSWLGDLIANS